MSNDKAKDEAEKKKPSPKKQTVRLKDLSGRLQVFNLPHDVYCKEAGECLCNESEHYKRVVSKDGTAGVLLMNRRLCASFTLLPNGHSEPLHEAVLKCPEVRSPMKARPTRVIKVGN